MARLVIPHLWEREGAGIRIWSAGCASGEEAYSLAILLHRHAVARGDRHRLETASVLGTDIDRASLSTAEQGTYPESAFADTPAELRQAYFSPTAPYSVRPEIRKLVRFSHHDLLRDPPEGRVHLITCRNVLIYFDRATQEALFQRFHDALVPGGYLVLGKVETLFGPARHRVVSVDARERIFQRPQS
jgi:chemotaxis methyl-accepting protein methylase